MHILHIIQRYWPAVGGAEIHLGQISSCLAAEGYQVTVLTTDALDFELFWAPGRRRVAERESWHEGVRILRFPVRHLPGCPYMYSAWRRLLWLLSAVQPVPSAWIARLARYTPWVPELERWLQTTAESYDVVAAATICFEPLLEAGLRFARRRRIPFVVYPLTHLGAGPAPASDALSRFYTMRHQLAIVRESDAVIVQTPAEGRFYASRGISSERMMVGGPAVIPAQVAGGIGQRWRERQGVSNPLVASIAPMSHDKGTMHLLEAMRRLRQSGRLVDLAFAGTILAPFQRYLATLPTKEWEWLHVLGPVSEEEKRDLLAAADVFAMPSRTDSFGIVYLEAWLYGKPVIGARTWGVSDVIADGHDGLLVPFGDVPALAKAIAELLDDPQRRSEMGKRGQRKVLQYHTWEVKYPHVRDLYRSLTGERESG